MSVTKQRPPKFRVGDDVRFLYGLRKVVGEVVEDRGPLGEYSRRLYGVRINHDGEDEATIVIPEENMEIVSQTSSKEEEPGLRQEFSVTYVRQKGNLWTARIERGRLYKGVTAEGVVAYSTAVWEGQREENHAIITILLECDPTRCDAHGRILREAWPELISRARKLADQKLKERHPDAMIEHVCED